MRMVKPTTCVDRKSDKLWKNSAKRNTFYVRIQETEHYQEKASNCINQCAINTAKKKIHNNNQNKLLKFLKGLHLPSMRSSRAYGH